MHFSETVETLVLHPKIDCVLTVYLIRNIYQAVRAENNLDITEKCLLGKEDNVLYQKERLEKVNSNSSHTEIFMKDKGFYRNARLL